MDKIKEKINIQQEQLNQLKSRWDNLFSEAPAEIKDRIFLELINYYNSPRRFYHNLNHLEKFLQEIEAQRKKINHPQILETAAWFHDAIYDTQSKTADSEQQSADFAKRALELLEIKTKIVQQVVDLILGTKTHQGPEDNSDSSLFMDIDLMILGAQPEEYNQYVKAIRQEYARVPEDVFRAKRKALLLALLSKPCLYQNQEMYQKYEAQARENIQRELAGYKNL